MRVRITIPKALGLAATVATVLTVMGCGSGGLGADGPAASPSPSTSTTTGVPTLGAPTSLPTVDTNPNSSPAVTTTTQSPTPPPGPKGVVTTREIDGTTAEGSGAKRTQVTYVTCDNGEPVSGIFIEGGTDEKSSKPYGDVDIDNADGTPNAATTIKLTHTVLASDTQYKFNFGCGYAAGGDSDWKVGYENFPLYNIGPVHRAKCPYKGDINQCAVDGSPVKM